MDEQNERPQYRHQGRATSWRKKELYPIESLREIWKKFPDGNIWKMNSIPDEYILFVGSKEQAMEYETDLISHSYLTPDYSSKDEDIKDWTESFLLVTKGEVTIEQFYTNIGQKERYDSFMAWENRDKSLDPEPEPSVIGMRL